MSNSKAAEPARTTAFVDGIHRTLQEYNKSTFVIIESGAATSASSVPFDYVD
jgi:hypothetical protein